MQICHPPCRARCIRRLHRHQVITQPRLLAAFLPAPLLMLMRRTTSARLAADTGTGTDTDRACAVHTAAVGYISAAATGAVASRHARRCGHEVGLAARRRQALALHGGGDGAQVKHRQGAAARRVAHRRRPVRQRRLPRVVTYVDVVEGDEPVRQREDDGEQEEAHAHLHIGVKGGEEGGGDHQRRLPRHVPHLKVRLARHVVHVHEPVPPLVGYHGGQAVAHDGGGRLGGGVPILGHQQHALLKAQLHQRRAAHGDRHPRLALHLRHGRRQRACSERLGLHARRRHRRLAPRCHHRPRHAAHRRHHRPARRCCRRPCGSRQQLCLLRCRRPVGSACPCSRRRARHGSRCRRLGRRRARHRRVMRRRRSHSRRLQLRLHRCAVHQAHIPLQQLGIPLPRVPVQHRLHAHGTRVVGWRRHGGQQRRWPPV